MIFLKTLKADIVIRIEDFQPIIKKGNLKDTTKIHLKNLTTEYEIQTGKIFVMKKTIEILGIEKKYHRKIRNIILSNHKYYF